MRDLKREEVVAMWLWSAEYAQSGLSAIGWWRTLDTPRRHLVEDFVKEYEAAAKREASPAVVSGRSNE
jgi:hypothetical protein